MLHTILELLEKSSKQFLVHTLRSNLNITCYLLLKLSGCRYPRALPSARIYSSHPDRKFLCQIKLGMGDCQAGQMFRLGPTAYLRPCNLWHIGHPIWEIRACGPKRSKITVQGYSWRILIEDITASRSFTTRPFRDSLQESSVHIASQILASGC